LALVAHNWDLPGLPRRSKPRTPGTSGRYAHLRRVPRDPTQPLTMFAKHRVGG